MLFTERINIRTTNRTLKQIKDLEQKLNNTVLIDDDEYRYGKGDVIRIAINRLWMHMFKNREIIITPGKGKKDRFKFRNPRGQ
jgi:hypothetical protein